MQRYNRRSNRLAIKLNLGYSSYFILLVLVCLCYISIFIKVRGSRQHQLHGVAGLRERKLTITSFLVTFASLLTFLPGLIWESMFFLHFMSVPNWSTYIQIAGIVLTLFLANSQGRHIKTAILQDVSRPSKSGRTSTSQSLVQADASFFLQYF